MRPFVLCFFALTVASAQIVSVGVKGGVPATNSIGGYYPSPTSILDVGRWTVGPTVELRLFYGFSVEADALYRRYREQFSFASTEVIAAGTGTFPAIYVASQSKAGVWDFPVLLKYRVGLRRFHPFVDAGYTFSHRTTDVTNFQSCVSSLAVCQTSSFPVFQGTTRRSFSTSSGGPTAGVGIEYRYHKLKIGPEVRYTHMSNPTANLLTLMGGVTF